MLVEKARGVEAAGAETCASKLIVSGTFDHAQLTNFKKRLKQTVDGVRNHRTFAETSHRDVGRVQGNGAPALSQALKQARFEGYDPSREFNELHRVI